MTLPVVNGAATMCTMGIAPSTLVVLPANRVIFDKQPAANVMDNKPFVNVLPFVLCNSLANPITAAQTTAALGVLTPGTCIPTLPAPWVPGSPTVMVANIPALTASSQCVCAYGGSISFTFGGATDVMVA